MTGPKLSRAWFIARQDLRQLLRERETLIWMFVMPAVFFYFIGTITGGMSADPSRVENIAVQAPGQPGVMFDRLQQRLQDNLYQVHLPDESGLYQGQHEFAAYRRRLTLPPDFSARVLSGEQSVLKFDRLEGGISQNFDEFRIARAVYTLLADLVALDAMDLAPAAENFAALDKLPKSIQIEASVAGKRLVIPSGFEQAIPGILIMFVLMQCLTATAVLLVIERRQGLLSRLASTPLSRGEILAGKWISRWFLGLVQVAVGMVYGTLFFSMEWGPDLAMVMVIMAAWAGFCASAGLFVGCIGRTEGQVIGLGVFSTMLLAALGGCWWPIEVTPSWMQGLAEFLPSGWAMSALHQLISFQNGPGAALQSLGLIAGGGLVLGYAGARNFRFQA
jgi:ABC-type multidrug transport system permease subunit